MAKWEKIASDYHSNFWKNYLFVKGATLQPKFVVMPQVHLAIRGYPKKIDYLYLLKTWKDGHEKLSFLADQNSSFVEKILEKTKIIGIKMNEYTESFIRDDLTKYSNKKIVEAYKKHAELNSTEYAWGIMIPILDFQDVHYFEDRLKAILRENLAKSEFSRAFAVFTQPLEDSFALDQEKSILKIFQNFPRQLLKKDTGSILRELKKRYPVVYRRLVRHTKKYAWVFYVYSGPAATEKDFFEILKFYAKKKIDPEKKLRQMAEERKKIFFERNKYFKKMRLSGKEKRCVELVAEVIYLKPRRKDYQSKSYFHLEFLQKEIGRRAHLSLDQVRTCTLEEINAALSGRKIDIHVINERMKFHIVIPYGERVKIYSEKAAQKYEKNIKKEKKEITQSEKLSGQTAYPGKAKGKVKRIDSPEEVGKMKEGDILVSSATAPNILPAIRLAAAIITDEGGLTCHAAIVSREFEIPCVVGTKNATKILRDGDLVGVDAGAGRIKIIRKAKI